MVSHELRTSCVITIALTLELNAAVLEVQDHGIGISLEDQQKIYELLIEDRTLGRPLRYLRSSAPQQV